jgi:hypothetical protein
MENEEKISLYNIRGNLYMAKHNVRQTKGVFRLKGNVVGVNRDDFFKNKLTSTGKDMNIISFGVKTSEENTTYVRLQGMTDHEAKFNKYDKENKKNILETVAWDDRFDFSKEGFQPQFGVRFGIDRDEKGNLTDQGVYFPYDVCLELKEKLKDDMGIFIQGQIDYSSFFSEKNGEKVKITGRQFKPTSIYSTKQDIDFGAEDFEEENVFKQEIIFMNIEKSTEEEGKFLIQTKIVTYSSVEDVEFVTRNAKLVNQFKKALKPYYMIEVTGRLVSKISIEENQEKEEVWGEDITNFDRVNAPRIKEMLITGAKPSTIDKDTYNAEIIDSIIKAENDFGKDENIDWGKVDEDIPWGD